MSNWCSTSVKITGKEEDVNNLYNLLKKWGNIKDEKKKRIEIDFEDIVEASKIDSYDLCLAGYVNNIKLDGNCLNIDTETSWGPILDIWYPIIDKYVEGGVLGYTAVEMNEDIYETNILEMSDYYFVYADEEKIKDKHLQYNPECPPKELKKRLQKLLESKTEDVDVLLKELKKSKYNRYISINKYDYTGSIPITEEVSPHVYDKLKKDKNIKNEKKLSSEYVFEFIVDIMKGKVDLENVYNDNGEITLANLNEALHKCGYKPIKPKKAKGLEQLDENKDKVAEQLKKDATRRQKGEEEVK